MSEKKEKNAEQDSSSQQSKPKSAEVLAESLQQAQNQLTDLILCIQKTLKETPSELDLKNQLTPIPRDSLRLSYLVKIEAEDGEVINFSNSTVIHQALGVNPVNTVARINTTLNSELIEPVVLTLQNYITSMTQKESGNLTSEAASNNFLDL